MSDKDLQTKVNLVLIRSFITCFFLIFFAPFCFSYPFATFVMDGRTGKTLYSQNANQKLHPASLTKMMTLYLVFHEIEKKRLHLDQKIIISRNASREPPSKFGYKSGQKVSVRFLIRASAIRSANDAATALAESVSGSEQDFGVYMTEMAKAMGMRNTQFKNANGLTASGHFSTARDMAILSRRLIYDFPEYYHLFGRNTVISSGRTLYNTNRKFLRRYNGADGIKTGFTSAAGYNLAASAKRGSKRVIGVIFGSGSVVLRIKRMSELLDIGFSKANGSAQFVDLEPLSLIKKKYLGRLTKSQEPLFRPRKLGFKDKIDGFSIGSLIDDLLESDKSLVVNKDESSMHPLPRPKKLFTNDLDKVVENGSTNLADRLITILEIDLVNKNYAVIVGSYFTVFNAKKDFTRIELIDLESLSSANRSVVDGVVNKKAVYRIRFKGLSKHDAVKACERLNARNEICEIVLLE